jgi:hypothetical protein
MSASSHIAPYDRHIQLAFDSGNKLPYHHRLESVNPSARRVVQHSRGSFSLTVTSTPPLTDCQAHTLLKPAGMSTSQRWILGLNIILCEAPKLRR